MLKSAPQKRHQTTQSMSVKVLSHLGHVYPKGGLAFSSFKN